MDRSKDIPGYLYALDGLRAVSVILIFIFHLWQQSWIYWRLEIAPGKYLFDFVLLQRFGYVAIDLFFVISGFCLFYPIAREMFGEAHRTSWKEFYKKRARRILPSYYLMLLLTVLFPAIAYMPSTINDASDVFRHFITHATFTHGLNDSTQGSLISTAWTMAIEVPFYIIFPAIAYFFRKKPILTFGVLAVLTEVVRLWAVTTFRGGPAFQANPVFYIDIFAYGMISAYAVVWFRNRVQDRDRVKLPMLLLSILSLVLIYQFIIWMSNASSQQFDAPLAFRMAYRPILAFGGALFLFSTCFTYRFWEKNIWGNRLFVFISTISYNFYLWHQNINIALRKAGIPYTTAAKPQDDRQAMDGFSLLSVVLSLFVASAITFLFEAPISKYGFKGYIIKIKELVSVGWRKITAKAGRREKNETAGSNRLSK